MFQDCISWIALTEVDSLLMLMLSVWFSEEAFLQGIWQILWKRSTLSWIQNTWTLFWWLYLSKFQGRNKSLLSKKKTVTWSFVFQTEHQRLVGQLWEVDWHDCASFFSDDNSRSGLWAFYCHIVQESWGWVQASCSRKKVSIWYWYVFLWHY